MTRVVSVGRSKSLIAAGAIGFTLLTISLSGCPGTLDDPGAFPSGGAGTSGSAGTPGTAGSGTSGTSGMAGTSGAAGSSGGGGSGATCDITPIFFAAGLPGKCDQAACHDAMGTSAGFSMTGDWETKLVNVMPKGGGVLPSICAQDTAFKTVPYIIKGSGTGDGLLLQKIMKAECNMGSMAGLQMPYGQPPLSATQIACVQKWATGLAAKP
jgi:hypothetical protein